MTSEIFPDITSAALAKTLDAAAARQKTIANNIANVETPGFKRGTVSFESELRRVLDASTESEIREGLQKLTPIQETDYQSPSRPDGNNVNIDAEISDLARTSLKYRAAATLLENKTGMLRAAISEGKK
ncbi:MAG: flagellar basal body rod protein FlgB [Armatimonadetes bacterium]|nr:flagellar basal body rod protein FlgB [Armatimonadota bacterium]